MKKFIFAEVVEIKHMIEDIYDMYVYAPEIAKNAKPGQFAEIYTGLGEAILPRPISFCEIIKEKGLIRFCFRVVGKGTKHFSEMKKGDKLRLLGPLGNGFEIPDAPQKSIVIGGGIGIPPLLELCKHLKGEVHVFLGTREEPILVEDFEKTGAIVHVCTENGCTGYHGYAITLVDELNIPADMIYSCGPKIMLKIVSDWAKKKNIRAQVSMEERMACGIGVCCGCAIKIQKKGEDDWHSLKVCKDGPVFWNDEVIW